MCSTVAKGFDFSTVAIPGSTSFGCDLAKTYPKKSIQLSQKGNRVIPPEKKKTLMAEMLRKQ